MAGIESQGRRRSSFKDRMRNIVVKDRLRSADAKVGGKNGRPSNVKVVHTLEDYKTAVGDENEKLVVVRFYATWCKVSAMEESLTRNVNSFLSTEILFVHGREFDKEC